MGSYRVIAFMILVGRLLVMLPTAQAQKTAEVSVSQSATTEDLPHWLTLDLELRSRTEGQTAINFLPGVSPVYDLTRLRIGVGVKAPKYFSAYLETQDSHALGLPLHDVASNMRNFFDFRQAYLRLDIAKTSTFVGRQELRFGDERLIGISNWTNNSHTFDVIRTVIGNPENHIDLFSGSVVQVRPTQLDTPRGGFDLHGTYATLTTLVPHVRLEPYVLMKTPMVTSRQGIVGRETLVAPGIRMTGKLPANFDYSLEGILERGSFANDSIRASAGYVKAGYTLHSLPWRPRIQAEYDYASGDPRRNPSVVKTFDQFFPSNHDVFGLTDVFGWQNIVQKRLDLDFHPAKALYVLLHGETLNVATTNDSVFSSSGGVLMQPPSGGFGSNRIGTEVDGALQYSWKRIPLLWELGIGHFWPSALMSANNHGTQLTLAYFQLTYRLEIGSGKARRVIDGKDSDTGGK
jgi:hypothetical protein